LHILGPQADEQAKKLEKEAADAERREAEKAARAAAAAQYRDAEWIAEAEADESDSDDGEAAELVAFACELCDKRFKSEAAFANHERCAAMHGGLAWLLLMAFHYSHAKTAYSRHRSATHCNI